MIPEAPATKQATPPLRDDLADYGAYVEDIGNGELLVEVGGIHAEEFARIAKAAMGAGWGPLAVGRVDPIRPDLAPHKTLWHSGLTGYNGTDATAETVTGWPLDIARRIAGGQERGLLNIAVRMPVGVIGLDVDNYGDKHGLDTLGRREAQWGTLPPTWRLTARPYASGSGIRLYRVPGDWLGVGEIPGLDGLPSHVEIIQRHHRYAVAPGGLHHTGHLYRLCDERTEAVMPPYWLLRPEVLPELPVSWRDGLRATGRTARRRGSPVTPADVAAFAEEFTFNAYPDELAAIVQRVRATGDTSISTRNACRDALWIAAHKAAAGCYPWTTAREAIRAAAVAAYAERGREIDAHDFDRLADGAVGQVLDTDDYADLVNEWGEDRRPATARRTGRAYRPAYRRAYRPAYRTMGSLPR